jgi:TIR domain
MTVHPPTVLLVENEPEWEKRFTASLNSSGIGSVKTIRSFNEAEKTLQRIDLIPISFVIIDVRLRRQLFDQGGLALLDIIKSRRPTLPVLLLSAYFDDYPGIERVIKRYRRAVVLDKDTFLVESESWIWRMIDMNMKWDAFISYRHAAADTAFARELCKGLEDKGYRVAIDERDFNINESFLEEMERCVRESRFTLAVISPRYFDSGNAVEESVICKVLGLRERKRRLIPLIIEKVEMPYWVYTIVGIDFCSEDPLIDPMERLIKTFGPPM